MLTKSAKEELERQHYRVIGEHSAVKTCGWTKNMIKGRGGCYKLKFYGIMSNQCMQMTTSISCANRCTFCWRGYKAPVSKEWKWGVDDPKFILDASKNAHHKLLQGFGGQPESKHMYNMSKTVKHVALSLTGEPITYPKMNELLKLFNKDDISTFLVTNSQYPEQIRDLERVTQLYLSVDAPNKELLKKVDVPLFPDFWERLNKSLEYCSQKKDRTCIRLTIIKELNDVEPENYAKLIEKGKPDFIEIKGYMHVGPSRQRLHVNQMPWHEEVLDFAKKILEHLPDYELVTEHVPSRVVMAARKDFKKEGKWFTWIDFPKWHELVNSNKDFNKFDFLKETPQVGLSGRITKDEVAIKLVAKRERLAKLKEEQDKKKKSSSEIFVDEKTNEMELE